MTFFYGQSQLTAAQNELTNVGPQGSKKPGDRKLAYHALIMLATGIAEALEDFSERLPPAK